MNKKWAIYCPNIREHLIELETCLKLARNIINILLEGKYEKNKLLERIEINPKVMVGKPVIKWTSLTVEFILNLLANGVSVEEILSQLPPTEVGGL